MIFGDLKLEARHGVDLVEIIPRGCRIQGESEWKLTGPASQVEAVRNALPKGLTESLTPDLLLLRLVNAVGTFQVPHLGRLEVVSGKWTEHDFEQMLRDVSQEVAALPFTASDLAKKSYEHELPEHREILYQVFVYLRHVLSMEAPRENRLDHAIEAIRRDPHRRLEPRMRRAPLSAASRIDAGYLARLAAGAETLRRAPVHLRDVPLCRALGGRLPEEVDETLTVRSLNTAENRFVKFFLEQADGIVRRVERLAHRRTERLWKRVEGDCGWMRRCLGVHLGLSVWDDVGKMTQLPAGSSILQRRRGYRDIYQHFLRLRASTCIPFDRQTLRDFLEIKNIAEMYELWCYFRVVAALSEGLGKSAVRALPQYLETDVTIPWDFAVEWPSGVRCLYNATFSKTKGGERASWSIPLRPDIAVWIPEGAKRGYHLFDAKFRLTPVGEWTAEVEDDDAAERRGTFKRVDLYKMHTYRDALEHVRSVRILYPGTEAEFFQASGETPDSGAGVGAVPLSPRFGSSELRAVMTDLVGAIGGPAASSEVA